MWTLTKITFLNIRKKGKRKKSLKTSMHHDHEEMNMYIQTDIPINLKQIFFSIVELFII